MGGCMSVEGTTEASMPITRHMAVRRVAASMGVALLVSSISCMDLTWKPASPPGKPWSCMDSVISTLPLEILILGRAPAAPASIDASLRSGGTTAEASREEFMRMESTSAQSEAVESQSSLKSSPAEMNTT